MTYYLFQNNRCLLLGPSAAWENLNITQIQNKEYLDAFVFKDILCGDLFKGQENKQLFRNQSDSIVRKIMEFAEIGTEGMYISHHKDVSAF